MPFSFAHPIWLIFILVAIPSVLAWRRYLCAPGVPPMLRAVVGLRAGALLCLVLALAGTQWLTRHHAVDIIFLADVSESVSPTEQAHGLEFIRTVASQLRDNDRAELIAFGREAYIDQPLGARLRNLQRIEASPGRGETDLQAALQLALAHADEKRNVRVVVVGDGLGTRGDAESLVPMFRERRIPIDAYSLATIPSEEASIEQVLAPDRVEQNQPFTVRVVVMSTYKSTGILRLFRNDTLINSRTVSLLKGQNVFEFTGLKEQNGVNSFTARLELLKDTYLQNNVGYATVTVEGPSRLLYVTDNSAASTALINALRRQGIRVDVTNTTSLPANATTMATYGALVLHDVSALKLSYSQQTQIASYVRNLGGGLVVIGGYNSYGLGGYMKTPLEEILPVTMDIPEKLVMPSLAMVLVLDKSGSMADTQGKLSKVNLAKEAALGVLDVMTDHDLFGLLAFESVTRWIVPLQPATERTQMAQQIGTLTADGGTDMGPAMLDAYNVLRKTDAMVKHVIILSDGQSQEYDFADVTAKLKSLGVTVSTVAIGTDSDRNLMEQIAKWGNGRFYYTDDIRSIPQIFTTEALVVSRPLAVEGRFKPVSEQPAPFLTGISQTNLPALYGYVLTTPKATANVHLVTAEENPILASWRYGLGRTVAFTSGVTNTWAADWLRWSGFGAFFSQTARWAMRPEGSSNLKSSFDIHDGQGSLVVDAIDKQGRFINFLNLKAEVISPNGDRQTSILKQSAPGQYQATFLAGEQGPWLAAVASNSDARFAQPTMVGTVLPYSAEYRLTGIDAGALERLTLQTGGRLFSGSQVPSRREVRTLMRHPYPLRTASSLAPLLLFVALLLFFIDIVLRYLPTSAVAYIEQVVLSRIPIMKSWSGSSVAQRTTSHDLSSHDTESGSSVESSFELSDSEDVEAYASKAKAAHLLRLDDLINRQRTEERTAQPRYNFGEFDPSKAAARYLAQLRAARRHANRADSSDDEGKPGA